MTTSKGKYALNTAVAPEKTQREIAELLHKYKVDDYELLIGMNRTGIAFKLQNRALRFILPMPKPKEMTEGQYAQQVRSAWRGLLLTLHGKLESIDRGIENFDEAFMGQIVMPQNETVHEWLSPQLDTIFKTGKLPPLLPEGK